EPPRRVDLLPTTRSSASSENSSSSRAGRPLKDGSILSLDLPLPAIADRSHPLFDREARFA
ncbi:hypothetical protein, partial [Rhizobium phaseoli]